MILSFLAMLLFTLFWGTGVCHAQSYDRQLSQKYTRQGKEAIKDRKYQQAFKYLQKAIEFDSKYAPAHAELARLYEAIGQRDKAIREYEAAMRLNSKNPNYYLELGVLFFKMKRYEDSLQSLLHAQELMPDNMAVGYHLGNTYKALNRYDEAIADYSSFLSIIEKDRSLLKDRDTEYRYFKTHQAMGEIYKLKKEWKKSAAHYEVILKSETAPSNLKTAVEADYKYVTKQRSPVLTWVVIALMVVLVFSIFYIIWRYAVLPQKIKATEAKLAHASQAKDYESLARFAFKHLERFTLLPQGLFYFCKKEDADLELVFAHNLDKKKFQTISPSWDEVKSWLKYNQGRPFIFESEKNEIPFVRAFPGAREKLEPAGPKVGVPFIFDNNLRGIGFMCYHHLIEESEKKKLKRTFIKNSDWVHKVGMEIGMTADTIFRRDAAINDPITPAYSQLYFREKLPEELNKCGVKRKSLTLLFMECDGLVAIQKRFSNDSMHHVLKTVATVILNHMRGHVDTLFRISDNRFAIILPGLDEYKGRDSAKKIGSLVAETQFTAPIPNITASIGMAVFPKHASKPGELENAARSALDDAVTLGRNQVVMAFEKGRKQDLEMPQRPFTQHLVLPPSLDTAEVAVQSVIPKKTAQMSKSAETKKEMEETKDAGTGMDFKGLKFRSAKLQTSIGPSNRTLSTEAADKKPAARHEKPEQPRDKVIIPPWMQRRLDKAKKEAGDKKEDSTTKEMSKIKKPVEKKETGGPAVSGKSAKKAEMQEESNRPHTSRLPSLDEMASDEGQQIQKVRRFKSSSRVSALKRKDTDSDKDYIGKRMGRLKKRVRSRTQTPEAGKPTVPKKAESSKRQEPGDELDLKSLVRRPQKEEKAKPKPKSEAVSLRKKKSPPKEAVDEVTGFFKRSYFEQNMGKLLVRAHKSQKPLSVIFFKVDKHREIKKKYGEEKLNNVLKEICFMIKNFIKEGNDMPARYNEEVFTLVLPDTSFQIAFNLAEQIRFTIGNLMFKDIPEQISLSLGMGCYPEKGKSPREILKGAYNSMVFAIKSGGDKSIIWDDKLMKKK